MFLPLKHTKLEAFTAANELLRECYATADTLPGDQKFNLATQIRRAALSVVLNIAEGSSRRSGAERKRFYEIARGSVIELDTAYDIAIHLNFLTLEQLDKLSEHLNKCFSLLTQLMNKG